MNRALLVLFVLLVFSANAVSAGDTGYCNTTDPCWDVRIQTQHGGENPTLTFTVTPRCKDVSCVAFGFPSAARIISPAQPMTASTSDLSLDTSTVYGSLPEAKCLETPVIPASKCNMEWYSQEVHCDSTGLGATILSTSIPMPVAGRSRLTSRQSPTAGRAPLRCRRSRPLHRNELPPDSGGSRRHSCKCRRRRVDDAPSPTHPSPPPK